MSVNKSNRFLKALLREPVDRTPVWIMRQAGRYLPEYRQTRAQAGSFLELCKNPKLATEVTLQPLQRFPQLDAAILFSDILTIPDAMGLGLTFQENEGPVFQRPISHRQDILDLPKLDIAKDLDYVLNAVESIRSALDNRVPLIGFSGSPWTLATYMVEGRGKVGFEKIKQLAYEHPKDLSLLLDKLVEAVADYLNAQISKGAQVVQIFDTWGGILSTQAYYDFSLNPMAKIIEQLEVNSQGDKVPVILFTKGGGSWLEAMAQTGADALGLDWTVDIKKAKKSVGNRVALQGNLDPSILKYNSEVVRQQTRQVLDDFTSDGSNIGHIFNLGHGITPEINPQRVNDMLNEVAQETP